MERPAPAKGRDVFFCSPRGESLPNLWRKNQGGNPVPGKYFYVPQFRSIWGIPGKLPEWLLNKGV